MRDLLEGANYLIDKPNIKSVIVAIDKNSKVMGYVIYQLKIESKNVEDLEKKIALINKNKEFIIEKLWQVSAGSYLYEQEYKSALKKLEVSYAYKTRAMPGYYWDDKDKIFKSKEDSKKTSIKDKFLSLFNRNVE